jgi:hypothetical protein
MATHDRRASGPRLPSIGRVIKTDFLALVGAIVPVTGLGLAIAMMAGVLPDKHRSLAEGSLRTIPAQPSAIVAMVAAGFGAVGAGLLIWRLRRIRSSFATGRRVEGTVTRLRPFKDRAYVHYAYRLNGILHEVVHFVHQTAAYRTLVEGQTVSIAVDPLRPRSGFIAELFE